MRVFSRLATPFFMLFLLWEYPIYAGERDFRFVVIGDTRGSDNGVNSTILSEMAAVVISEGAELVMVTGDLTNDGLQAELEYWRQLFWEPLEAAGIAVYSVRGNHDARNSHWNTVFSGPYALPGDGPPGEINKTYSLTHKNALFVGLDTHIAGRVFQVNQTWLDGVFRANVAPHVFVFGHAPAFSVQHADCLDDYPDQRDAFWNSIGRADGRVYFAGHDHFYNRARIKDSMGVWIHQYVVGSGGAPLVDWSGEYGDSSVEGLAHFKEFGYVVGDVNGYEVTLTFKQRTGEGAYEATSDVFSYDAAPPKLVPLAPIALWFIVFLCVSVLVWHSFGLRI
ncbi:metallophosphoesterase family protein [Candidatus Hydrogenedentota bacterium]